MLITAQISKDDVIIEEGRTYTELRQLASGSCRVEKYINGKKVVLNIMSAGAIFGDISVLQVVQ
jgi:CRP-like cAMP-binding protein